MIGLKTKGLGNDDYCKLLMHFEETIGAANPPPFTESSFGGNGGANHTCYLLESAGGSTPALSIYSKFGTKSVLCYGDEGADYSYIRAGGGGVHADWTFGDKAYTWDVCVKPELHYAYDSSISDNYMGLMGLYVDASNYNLVTLYRNHITGDHQIVHIIREAASTNVSLSYTVTDLFDGNFHHIAVSRDRAAYSLYYDGIMVDKATYIGALITLNDAFRVGNVGVNSTERYLNYVLVDEFRLSLDICRYPTSTAVGELAFEVPTIAN